MRFWNAVEEPECDPASPVCTQHMPLEVLHYNVLMLLQTRWCQPPPISPLLLGGKPHPLRMRRYLHGDGLARNVFLATVFQFLTKPQH